MSLTTVRESIVQGLKELRERAVMAVKKEAQKSLSRTDEVEEDRLAEEKARKCLELIKKKIEQAIMQGGRITAHVFDEGCLDTERLSGNGWNINEARRPWLLKVHKYLVDAGYRVNFFESVAFTNGSNVQAQYRLVISW